GPAERLLPAAGGPALADGGGLRHHRRPGDLLRRRVGDHQAQVRGAARPADPGLPGGSDRPAAARGGPAVIALALATALLLGDYAPQPMASDTLSPEQEARVQQIGSQLR